MAIILNIDSSIDAASLCISKNGESLCFQKNDVLKDHTIWMHSTLQSILTNASLTMKDMEAVAVTIGPGSYTGLRIGLAAAKGFCYALNIPLVTINTLELMTDVAIKNLTNVDDANTDLFCPMIDARRMEVFTALYNCKLETIEPPRASILDTTSFSEKLATNKIHFFGNGSMKFQNICVSPSAFFESINWDARNLIPLVEKKTINKEFTDLAYSEPLYLKEYYTPAH